MARFAFKLEAVLRHRRFVEDQRQGELGVVQREMVRLQTELRALNESVSSVGDDLRANRLTGRLDLHFLAAHRRYTQAMQRKGVALVQEMAKQQREVERAQAALAEAVKQRKIVEKLKERQRERWLVDQGRREAAQTDEVGTQLSSDPVVLEELASFTTGGDSGADDGDGGGGEVGR
jgi:flagellar protein FliJ